DGEIQDHLSAGLPPPHPREQHHRREARRGGGAPRREWRTAHGTEVSGPAASRGEACPFGSAHEPESAAPKIGECGSSRMSRAPGSIEIDTGMLPGELQ